LNTASHAFREPKYIIKATWPECQLKAELRKQGYAMNFGRSWLKKWYKLGDILDKPK
jgi:hypothetical protein